MERTPKLLNLPSIDEYNLQDALEAAQEELVKLLQEREQMEWRINKLQNDIVHLAALCRVEVEDPIRQLGLTDAVRWIFARDSGARLGTKRPLSIKQVVEELQKSWSDAAAYKNLQANVHTVVRRLKKAGEIEPSSEVPAYPYLPALGGIGGLVEEEDKYVWGGGLPPMPPDLKSYVTLKKDK
jgi:hypothetical protein